MAIYNTFMKMSSIAVSFQYKLRAVILFTESGHPV